MFLNQIKRIKQCFENYYNTYVLFIFLIPQNKRQINPQPQSYHPSPFHNKITPNCLQMSPTWEGFCRARQVNMGNFGGETSTLRNGNFPAKCVQLTNSIPHFLNFLNDLNLPKNCGMHKEQIFHPRSWSLLTKILDREQNIDSR